MRCVSLILCLMPLPALADAPAHCWDMNDAKNLFAWAQAPSTACRAAQTVTGAPVLLLAPAMPEQTHLPHGENAQDAAPGVVFTFSGQTYVGVAAAF